MTRDELLHWIETTHGGHVTKAAESLGVSRVRLNQLIHGHKVDTVKSGRKHVFPPIPAWVEGRCKEVTADKIKAMLGDKPQKQTNHKF